MEDIIGYIIQRKKDKFVYTTSRSWNRNINFAKVFKQKSFLFKSLKYLREWNKTNHDYNKIDIKKISIFTIKLGKADNKIIKDFKTQQTLNELEKN